LDEGPGGARARARRVLPARAASAAGQGPHAPLPRHAHDSPTRSARDPGRASGDEMTKATKTDMDRFVRAISGQTWQIQGRGDLAEGLKVAFIGPDKDSIVAQVQDEF